MLLLWLVACGSTPDIKENTNSRADQVPPMDTSSSTPEPILGPELDENGEVIPTEPFILNTNTEAEVIISGFEDRQVIDSPLMLTGYVPADWIFEEFFPITLLTDSGEIIAETRGSAEWIDDDNESAGWQVFFQAVLEFETPPGEDEGKLKLSRALPNEDGEEEYVETLVLWE